MQNNSERGTTDCKLIINLQLQYERFSYMRDIYIHTIVHRE